MEDFTYLLIESRQGLIPGVPSNKVIGELFFNIDINTGDIIKYENNFYQVQFRVIKEDSTLLNPEIKIELYCFKLNTPYPFINEN